VPRGWCRKSASRVIVAETTRSDPCHALLAHVLVAGSGAAEAAHTAAGTRGNASRAVASNAASTSALSDVCGT
jgi:hypothetical protein